MISLLCLCKCICIAAHGRNVTSLVEVEHVTDTLSVHTHNEILHIHTIHDNANMYIQRIRFQDELVTFIIKIVIII